WSSWKRCSTSCPTPSACWPRRRPTTEARIARGGSAAFAHRPGGSAAFAHGDGTGLGEQVEPVEDGPDPVHPSVLDLEDVHAVGLQVPSGRCQLAERGRQRADL